MEKIIKEKLRGIEKKHDVVILFAIESGSRAWGFPSPDSDYDVRFVYLHRPDWYLSIRDKDEVIELPVNEVLDINGWDFRKALQLLSKPNAVLFEWIQSPIFYKKNEAFFKGFNMVAQKSFSPIAVMHHYFSMSKKHYEECTTADKVKLKKYMYALRATLSCDWIAKRKTVPPMELKKLMDVIKSQKELVKKIHELVELKGTMAESYYHREEPLLDTYLKKTIEHCELVAPNLPANRIDYDMVDRLYRNVVTQRN